LVDPSLSSVYQPGFQIGSKATELLLDMIEKKISADQIQSPVVLNTKLIMRKSSKKRG